MKLLYQETQQNIDSYFNADATSALFAAVSRGLGDQMGIDIQRFRCEVLVGGDSRQYKSVSVKRESGLGRKSEQFADEVSLADHISISQPSHSALPDHVHGLDTLQRPPRTLKGSIALGQPNSLFHRPVVLFNHVIEILALA
jgi:hypothetical protein